MSRQTDTTTPSTILQTIYIKTEFHLTIEHNQTYTCAKANSLSGIIDKMLYLLETARHACILTGMQMRIFCYEDEGKSDASLQGNIKLWQFACTTS